MYVDELGNVVHLAIDDYPAVIAGIVFLDLVEGDETLGLCLGGRGRLGRVQLDSRRESVRRECLPSDSPTVNGLTVIPATPAPTRQSTLAFGAEDEKALRKVVLESTLLADLNDIVNVVRERYAQVFSRCIVFRVIGPVSVLISRRL